MNTGKQILKLLGGEDNIFSISHCGTRLRLSYVDKEKISLKEIEELQDVMEVMESEGQYLIIVGPHACDVYEELIANTRFSDDFESQSLDVESGGSIITKFLDTVAGIFTPLLPVLAGAGVLRGIVLLLSQLGFLSDVSGTYVLLTAASMSVFYFFPIMLAFTSASRFGANQFISAAIMGALLMPEFMSLLDVSGSSMSTTFMGIPVLLMSYPYTVIPAILSIYIQSKLERVLRKVIPIQLHLLFVSLLSLLIMVPLTAIVLGPFGVYVGQWLTNIIDQLMSLNGWIAGAFIGGAWNVMVIFGLQWAVNPIMIQNIATVGFDRIVPLTAAANFGMAGAAFGTFLKTKDSKMKSYSFSALLSIFFAGITEPAIYGIAVRYKKPLIAAVIGGVAGGAFIGGMGVKANAFVFGGLTTIPAFAGETLVYYLIGLIICFVISTIITVLLGLDETVDE